MGTIKTEQPKCQPGLWCALGSLNASPLEESTRAALGCDPAMEGELQNREIPGELHVGSWLPHAPSSQLPVHHTDPQHFSKRETSSLFSS